MEVHFSGRLAPILNTKIEFWEFLNSALGLD